MSMTTLTEKTLAASAAEAKREASLYRIAWMVTVGALALAVTLGLGLPARAQALPSAGGELVQLIDHKGKRHGYKKDHRKTLPAVCAMEIGKGRHSAVVYPERCLRRQGFDARLPKACADVKKVRGERLRVFYENCMRKAGFYTARDHRPHGRPGDYWGR